MIQNKSVRYGSAILDESERRVDINDIDAAFCEHHTFNCPCCHKPMYATFGSKQLPHFRHYGERCDYQNYLHALAELTFKEEYNYCLTNGIPFIIECLLLRNCEPWCQKRHSPCEYKTVLASVNLTEKYKRLFVEKRVDLDGHYRRPDILLEAENGEHIWVEIWVSHETDDKKRNDGNIIEIRVKSEDDLKRLKEHRLHCIAGSALGIRVFGNVFPKSIRCDKPVLESEESPKVPVVPAILSKMPSPKFADSLTSEEPIKWIDLGLPSGILWAHMDGKPNEDSDSTILPTRENIEEIKSFCKQEISEDKLKITGPNGNFIMLNPVHYRLSSHQSIDGVEIVSVSALVGNNYLHIFDDDYSWKHHFRYIKLLK